MLLLLLPLLFALNLLWTVVVALLMVRKSLVVIAVFSTKLFKAHLAHHIWNLF